MKHKSFPIPQGFIFKNNLPDGFYGPSIIVLEEETKNQLIMKFIRKSAIADLNMFKLHIESVRSINCPIIVSFQKIIEDDEFLILGRPFIEGMNLYKYATEGLTVDNNVLFALWKVIVRTVHHLHSYNICPNFIKPNNIILTDRTHIYFVDELPPPTNFNPQIHGSSPFDIGFFSPEFFTGRLSLQVAKQSDIFSLGVLLFFLMTKRLPWTQKSVIAIINEISNNNNINFDDVPNDVSDLIRSILVKDPQLRPSTANLLAQNPGTIRNVHHSGNKEKRKSVNPSIFSRLKFTGTALTNVCPRNNKIQQFINQPSNSNDDFSNHISSTNDDNVNGQNGTQNSIHHLLPLARTMSDKEKKRATQAQTGSGAMKGQGDLLVRKRSKYASSINLSDLLNPQARQPRM